MKDTTRVALANQAAFILSTKKGAEARAERAAWSARWLAFSTFVFLIALLTCFARRASAYPKVGARHEFGRSQCTNSLALKIRKPLRRGFLFVSSDIPILCDS